MTDAFENSASFIVLKKNIEEDKLIHRNEPNLKYLSPDNHKKDYSLNIWSKKQAT